MSGLNYFDDGNFEAEVIKSDIPVLVDFWAEWCAPCRMINPIVESLAAEYNGKVKFGKMDMDKSSVIPMQYAVSSIPSLILFKKGEPVEKIIGAVSKNKIKSVLDNAL